MAPGYYRFPTIHDDQIVYVCEDDLWTVPITGGATRRLTSNLGSVTSPSLSQDGKWLSFVGREDGEPEVYLMPARGGAARRMTFLGSSMIQTAGWTADGRILFASNTAQPFRDLLYLYTLSPDGGGPVRLETGPARAISFGPNGGRVIGRNTGDPARWKRYRGGTAGQLWVDQAGDGNFAPLTQLKGNLSSPMWVGERIYFLSDHEGVGNLYSCLPSGANLLRHTDHDDFYTRNASTDGKRIVYHAGADLFMFDIAIGVESLVAVESLSPQVQRSRKFVDPGRYIEEVVLHPKGHALALSARGHLFTFAAWEGAVMQHGIPEAGVRYRLPHWLNDGKRLLAVDDSSGEETLILLDSEARQDPVRMEGLDIGRIVSIAVNPKKDQVVFSNHRYELIFLDLVSRETAVIDRGRNDRTAGFDWSPDGEWVVYASSISIQQVALKLWRASTHESFLITQPVLRDVAPVFEPQGKYIYFLSFRTFDPVFDNLQFEFNFPRGMQPYLITLQKDTPSPFILVPKPLEEEKKEPEPPAEGEKNAADGEEKTAIEGQPVIPSEDVQGQEKKEEKPLQIDLDGIQMRLVAFPVEEGRYGRVMGTADGKVLYTRYPVEGTLDFDFLTLDIPAKGKLLTYNFDEQKEETLFSGISDFELNGSRKAILIRAGSRLRVLKAGVKPPDENGSPSRKTGWIDLGRVRVPVVPEAEWRQMFREAWRLQRDQFWNPEMSGVDWVEVYNRYAPLVERVAARSEFSDLTWEMQGELGTSHCYEFGGDYRPAPRNLIGNLAADFEFDEQQNAWRITRIAHGDAWDVKNSSPFARPGLNVRPGDRLLAVNGRRLSRELSPGMALVNLANTEVNLLFAADGEGEPRSVTVKTLGYEEPVRYREWVEGNRQKVHQATDEKVGYIHIPDMGSWGYAEFHRGFLSELDRPGLIVDVRFNHGGSVSPLLLEKLARRRIGYDMTRWDQDPHPYPPESVLGPMVALTNEFSGSDGDIFSHGFKLMGLGPLIGTRTWGGVVGIWPRHALVDGSITTQPEFSFWFKDVGWGVENYGTDPDIEIDNTPQDYVRGVDAQLDRTIAEILQRIQDAPPALPEFQPRPSRALPRLPKR